MFNQFVMLMHHQTMGMIFGYNQVVFRLLNTFDTLKLNLENPYNLPFPPSPQPIFVSAGKVYCVSHSLFCNHIS